MEYTDPVLSDPEHMDPEMHRQGSWVDNALIPKNARIMASMRTVRVSLPLTPDCSDSRESLSVTVGRMI